MNTATIQYIFMGILLCLFSLFYTPSAHALSPNLVLDKAPRIIINGNFHTVEQAQNLTLFETDTKPPSIMARYSIVQNDAGEFYLIIAAKKTLTSRFKQAQVPLKPGIPVSIGRWQHNDLQISYSFFSRIHVWALYHNNTIEIKNLSKWHNEQPHTISKEEPVKLFLYYPNPKNPYSMKLLCYNAQKSKIFLNKHQDFIRIKQMQGKVYLISPNGMQFELTKKFLGDSNGKVKNPFLIYFDEKDITIYQQIISDFPLIHGELFSEQGSVHKKKIEGLRKEILYDLYFNRKSLQESIHMIEEWLVVEGILDERNLEKLSTIRTYPNTLNWTQALQEQRGIDEYFQTKEYKQELLRITYAFYIAYQITSRYSPSEESETQFTNYGSTREVLDYITEKKSLEYLERYARQHIGYLTKLISYYVQFIPSHQPIIAQDIEYFINHIICSNHYQQLLSEQTIPNPQQKDITFINIVHKHFHKAA